MEIPESVLIRELHGESVLLDLESECYFGLDEVGTRMWKALASSGSLDEACDLLLAEFDVAGEELRSDLAAFVDTLAGEGLVRVVPE